MFLQRTPPPPLSAFVDSVWYSERGALPHRRERALPTGCTDIVVPLLQAAILRCDSEHDPTVHALRGAVVQGPHDRFGVRGTEGPSAVIGVHFRPGGAAALFGGALPDLRNRTVLLEDLWGASARHLRERLQGAATPAAKLALMESHLWRCLQAAPPPDPLVESMLAALARDPSQARIEPLQRASGCAPAVFIARFERAVGLTPKRYARVLRFGALLPSLARQGPRDWAQVAVAGGYFDQSHLIREFRRLAGVTPAAYVPVGVDRPTHVALGDMKCRR